MDGGFDLSLDFSFLRTAMIDDKPEELLHLAKALHQIGIHCTTVKYDPDPEQLGNLRYLHGSNIIFLDLHLLPGAGIGADYSGPIIDVLNKLAIDSPYLLVVWSSFSADGEAIINKVLSRLAADTLKPIAVSYLDKHKYNVDGAQAGKELVNEVISFICDHPQVLALLAWEGRVGEAAAKLGGRLVNLAKVDQGDYKNNLSPILYAVANGAAGSRVHENCASSIEAGLMPLLEDQLAKEADDGSYKELWSKALPKKPCEIQNITDKWMLNTCLLLEENHASQKLNCRGAWLTVDDKTSGQIQTIFGKNLSDIVKEVFISNPSNIDDLERKKQITQVRCQALTTSKVGIFTYMAPCDYAQRKEKMIMTFLSALIPQDADIAIKDGLALYKSPVIWHDGAGYILTTHFQYVTSITKQLRNCMMEKCSSTPFRLRDQLLNDIALKYSAYITRPGLISIAK